MIDNGEGGALVATSSTSAIHGAAGNEAYGTSKTALLGFCRALAVNLARHQIRVNALLPGWTITELAQFGYANDRFREATLRRTPFAGGRSRRDGGRRRLPRRPDGDVPHR